RRGRRDPPEHGHRGRTQGPPRLAGEPGPGCASLTRATRLTGATRLHVARIRPKAASGVAHGSVATRAQGPARTLPQEARTRTATIGRRAGPGCASLTRATRLAMASRLHVARTRPKAASWAARGSVAPSAQGPARP